MYLNPIQLTNNYLSQPSGQTDLQRLLAMQMQQQQQPNNYGPGAFAAYARFQNLQNQQPAQPTQPQISVQTAPQQPEMQDPAHPQTPPPTITPPETSNLGLTAQNAAQALFAKNPNRQAMMEMMMKLMA